MSFLLSYINHSLNLGIFNLKYVVSSLFLTAIFISNFTLSDYPFSFLIKFTQVTLANKII